MPITMPFFPTIIVSSLILPLILVSEPTFFAADSFWNQPLPQNAKIDPRSDLWISLLAQEPAGAYFGINTDKYTIPVYIADENTPRYTVYHREVSQHFKDIHGHNNSWFETHDHYGHGNGFGQNVPIPEGAMMDPQEDAHMVIVDWNQNRVWDVWGLEFKNGRYASFTGMTYDAKGSGVFDPSDFKVQNGESIHFYGPGRAAGVPVVAGLILYSEVEQGCIPHKLAIATRHNAYQEFVYPATWTDGVLKGGIPEGAIIQLDPELDLDPFELTPEERIVATAAQQYGMVVVDDGGGNAIYAEGLYENSTKNWKGKLRGWEAGLISIPIQHYRVIETGPTQKGGLNPEVLNKRYFQVPDNRLEVAESSL